MENTTKLTYGMALDVAIEMVESEEVKKKLKALKVQIAKKNASGSGKPTKNQIENEKIMNTILDVLLNGKAYTVTELIKADERLNNYTNQKLSALLTKLVNSGKVNRIKDGKTSTFSIVEG